MARSVASMEAPWGRYQPLTRDRRLVLAGVVIAHLALFWVLLWQGLLEGGQGRLSSARNDVTMTVFGVADQAAPERRRLAGDPDAQSELRPQLGQVPSEALVQGSRDAKDREELTGDATALAQALASALADDPLAVGAQFDYRKQLIAHIRRFLFYPREALDRGLSGTVVVRFRLDRAGQVIDLRVVSTKGAVLDTAAMGTIWKAEPLPAVPSSIETPWEVDVPIDFNAPMQGRR